MSQLFEILRRRENVGMGPVVALGLHTFSVIREVMRNYTGEKDILQYFYKKNL